MKHYYMPILYFWWKIQIIFYTVLLLKGLKLQFSILGFEFHPKAKNNLVPRSKFELT